MNADSREVNTVGEPDAGNPPVRFDGGAVVTRAWESLGFRGLPCSKRPPPPYPTNTASRIQRERPAERIRYGLRPQRTHRTGNWDWSEDNRLQKRPNGSDASPLSL